MMMMGASVAGYLAPSSGSLLFQDNSIETQTRKKAAGSFADTRKLSSLLRFYATQKGKDANMANLIANMIMFPNHRNHFFFHNSFPSCHNWPPSRSHATLASLHSRSLLDIRLSS